VVLHHSDYAFGKSLEQNATVILQGLGATVLGHSLVPLGETDYSAHLLAAASSARAGGRYRLRRRRLHQRRETMASSG